MVQFRQFIGGEYDMKALVAGAAGFMGSHLCRDLVANGHNVIGIDDLNPTYSPVEKRQHLAGLCGQGRFRLVEGDACNQELVTVLCRDEKIACIFNCAGRADIPPSFTQPHEYQRGLLGVTMTLLEACVHGGVARFVHVGSSSVYGKVPALPINEDSDTDTPISIYGALKKSAELLGHAYHVNYGISVINCRVFSAYGPDTRPDQVIYKLARLIDASEEVTLVTPSASRDFVHVHDVARALRMLASAQHVSYGVYNIGSGQAISIDEICLMLEQVIGKKANRTYVPTRASETPYTCADIQRIKAAVGWGPEISMSEGVAGLVRWYRQSA